MIKEYIIKGKGYFNCNVENPFDLNLQINMILQLGMQVMYMI